jgi:hypothetical protein
MARTKKRISKKRKSRRYRRQRKYKGGQSNDPIKTVIKLNKNAGFFSTFTKYICHLSDYPNTVEIEYDVRATKPGEGAPFINEGEELFSKLFKPYNENKAYTNTIVVENYIPRYFEVLSENNVFDENRKNLQPLADAYSKYVNLLPHIQEKLDKLTNELRADCEQVIGILVRTKPGENQPTRQDFLDRIAKIDKTKKTKYFIRSDNDADLEFYKQNLKQNYYTNIKRSKNATTNASHVSSTEYMTLQDLEDLFIEIALLSKCDILVHNSSNMATTALFMNMKLQSIFLRNK